MKVSEVQKKMVERLAMFLIILLINMVVLKFLWNNVLSKHITILKPIEGIKDAIMLSIALSLIKLC